MKTLSIQRIEKHFEILLTRGMDKYGEIKAPMFMSMLDPGTAEYPSGIVRPGDYPSRAYRLINAPGGCNPYWDQPSLLALYLLARHTGKNFWKESGDAYLRFFINNCTGPGGLFLWGNHYYWDAFADCVMEFGESPVPADRSKPVCLHEMRPVIPIWREMYAVNPRAVRDEIAGCVERHVFEPETGAFNRHSNKTRGCAFLESGAVLIYSLCFLYSVTLDECFLEKALRIAGYSNGRRHPRTGLIPNNPTAQRWDARVSTTETGFWSHVVFNSLKFIKPRKTDSFPSKAAEKLYGMCKNTLSAYLRYGYDADSAAYYGKLNLNGSPDISERETIFQPGNYSDPWEYLFPTHDYPLQMGMGCLDFLEDGEIFEQGARRWAGIILRESRRRGRGRKVRLAENYGRMIVFLKKYSIMTGDREYGTAAWELLENAAGELGKQDLIIGRDGGLWYESIDGTGYLLLAGIYLETGNEEALGMF